MSLPDTRIRRQVFETMGDWMDDDVIYVDSPMYRQILLSPEYHRSALDDISGAVSQTRLPGMMEIPSRSLPMVRVHHTPPQPSVVFSPPKTPRRSKRGYRWVPVTPPPSNERSKSLSPVKSPPLAPNGSQSPGTRRSPRKKLVYFPEEPPNNPPTPKKVKFEFSPKPSPSLKARLYALSKDQLISMIGNISKDHAEIQSELTDMIPLPDLKPIDAHIKHLRYCIHKALPRLSKSRLQSKTDAVAFARTEVHVYNLKKYVFETGATLEKSEYWSVVVDFAIMAWNSVRMTPVWDRPIHNETRNQCYQYLSKLLARAIRKGNFSKDELVQIQKQTSLLESDSTCFVQLNSTLTTLITKEEDD